MSNKRRIKRTKSSQQVDSWELRADTPGVSFTETPAADVVDNLLLAHEAWAISTAVRHADDKATWEPMVIFRVSGRYNQTDITDEIVIGWPAAAVEEVAASLIAAAKAANSDAAAEALKEELGWGDH